MSQNSNDICQLTKEGIQKAVVSALTKLISAGVVPTKPIVKNVVTSIIKGQKYINSEADAKRVGTKLGIKWDQVSFKPKDLLQGYNVEMEHGLQDPETDVTGNDPEVTLKIAWAHLKESPNYYKELEKMEEKMTKAEDRKLSGWISPEGKFHEVTEDGGHDEVGSKLKDKKGNKFQNTKDMYDEGWISTGHAGGRNASGHSSTLSDSSHPATKELARRVKKIGTDESFLVEHSETKKTHEVSHKQAKRGNFKKPSKVQEFRKAEPKPVDEEVDDKVAMIGKAQELLRKVRDHKMFEFLHVDSDTWTMEMLDMLQNVDPADVPEDELFYIINRAKLYIAEANTITIKMPEEYEDQPAGRVEEIPINKIIYLKPSRNPIRKKRLDYQLKHFDEAPSVRVHLIDLGAEEGNWLYPPNFDENKPHYFLENGHHRLMAAIKLGEKTLRARVYPLPPPGKGWPDEHVDDPHQPSEMRDEMTKEFHERIH